MCAADLHVCMGGHVGVYIPKQFKVSITRCLGITRPYLKGPVPRSYIQIMCQF